MEFKLVIPLLALVVSQAAAQSPAAMQRVESRYAPEQIEEMRSQAHYKYAGLVLFYSRSFLVLDDQPRHPSEEEIAIIDLNAYDPVRQVSGRVTVQDPILGKSIILLARDEFEQVVLDELSEVDRAAYLNYKDAALRDWKAKQP